MRRPHRRRARAADARAADARDPDEPDQAVAGEATPWVKAVTVISAIGPPVTVVTALLLYFGWARTDSQARAMGLDVSLFGYSPQDYILRSINSLFLPLIVLLGLGVAVTGIRRALGRRADGERGRETVRRGAGVVAVAAAVVAVGLLILVLTRPLDSHVYVPYALAALVWLVADATRLRRRAAARAALTREQRAVETTLVLCIVTLLLFWGTADFAQTVGRSLAARYEQSVGTLPRAELVSPHRLAINSPGVTERSVGTADAPLYRYSGLRLLVLSNGRFFFLHDGWTLARGRIVIVPDDGAVHFEFGNGPAP
ncbi:hypothetical protein [Cryobacterium sp. PH29-G1]|uniref:hypothetical protein n=1 Tax=Cryobacterium sp. PH29-G1 TaxID=3046211 RepID=UPI0024B9AB4E|nr:hypothetical protein [Cryobacterium sp. PH29-G1]MDJ0349104.1 hypothetical protein [Cryobacterium sp. PH29-G1]